MSRSDHFPKQSPTQALLWLLHHPTEEAQGLPYLFSEDLEIAQRN